MRKFVFENEHHYHIFNRGVDKRKVFLNVYDYKRFLRSMQDFNQEIAIESLYRQDQLKKNKKRSGSTTTNTLVEIVCYCLNPNHFHLILKQVQDRGIEKFMHKLSTGYTRYFNERNSRSGVLFQGRYKADFISSNEKLLQLSTYVNANNFIHRYNDNFSWPYCSLPEYLGKRNSKYIISEDVLGQFENTSDYYSFVKKNAKLSKEKKHFEK